MWNEDVIELSDNGKRYKGTSLSTDTFYLQYVWVELKTIDMTVI